VSEVWVVLLNERRDKPLGGSCAFLGGYATPRDAQLSKADDWANGR